ncbi:MAG: RNA polymerase sigma factor [Sporichthyaceae bacterium]
MKTFSEGDADAWAQAVAGDGEAFAVLFDRHGGRVFRHACRMVEGRQDAEDVTAATFLELWRRRADVRIVDGSVLPWLLITAGNVARNINRARRRHGAFLARLPRLGTFAGAAEIVLDRSVDPRLRSALRALDPVDLHLVSLVALEDRSIAEAAQVLGLTAAAAKSRLHRARHRLRGVLAQHSEEVQAVASHGRAS